MCSLCVCVCVCVCVSVCVCVLTSMPVVVAYIVDIISYALQQAVLTDCLILLPPGSKAWRALINIRASSQQQNNHQEL